MKGGGCLRPGSPPSSSPRSLLPIRVRGYTEASSTQLRPLGVEEMSLPIPSGRDAWGKDACSLFHHGGLKGSRDGLCKNHHSRFVLQGQGLDRAPGRHP